MKQAVMEVDVDLVVVREGRRPVNQDKVRGLAESIEEIGLLHPINVLVEDDGTIYLVAGAHRLEAHKLLERTRIPAVPMDNDEIIVELAEIDENLIREDLTPAQRATYTARRKQLYLARHPETGQGKAPGAKGSTKGGKAPKNDNMSSLPTFTDDTSKKSGKNKRTVERDARRGEKVAPDVLKEVTGTDFDTGVNLDTLARLDEDGQKELVAHAKEKGITNLKTAKRNLTRKKSVESIQQEPAPLPEGPFRVIAADPAWPYDRVDDATHRGAITYESMTIEEICALPVPSLAHDDCILFCWTTNAFMHEAYHVVEAWEFTPKTILTWCKSKMGAGNWLRNQTEHCIVAVRGNPVVELTNQTTILEGNVREHSRKPTEFYELVESLCPGAKVELFAREARDGWERWGSETEKFSEPTT